MTHPSSAREALIVEALGDVARLLEQVEELTRSVEAARTAMVTASAQLHSDIKSFSTDVRLATDQAKVGAVAYVRTQALKAARESMLAQAQAMATAARRLFAENADANFSHLLKVLQQVAQRIDRPWEIWMTYAATAVASAFLMWCIYTWYILR